MSDGDGDEKTNPAKRPPRVGAVEDGEVLSGRYRLIRFIAAGGMGEVWEAEDTTLKENVALKTVRPEVVDAESLERFRREVKLARRISHRNVCRVFEFGEHVRSSGEKVSYLTMELLKGLPLEEVLRRKGKMTPGEALPLLSQMAAALDAAHAEGIIHRDFKSPNVFLEDQTGGVRVVVTDFGIARAVTADDRLTSSKQGMMGTPGFMAPEQVDGTEVGKAADLYSLGVVAFEMVTGTLPFSGDSAIAVAIKRLNELPRSARSLVAELPVHWDQALFVAMSRRPEHRFSSGAQFVHALANEVVATPLRRPSRPRGPQVALSLVAVIAAASGVAWWQTGRLPRGERTVAIHVTEQGVPDGWLASATASLAELAWCQPPLPYRCSPVTPNVDFELTVRREKTGVTLVLRDGPTGGRKHALATVSAASVAEGLERLAPAVKSELGGAGPNLSPTVEEQAEAKQLGATSIDAFREYQRADLWFRSTFPDDDAAASHLEAAIRLDPGWAHPWAQLVLLHGEVGERAAATLAKARIAVGDPARDLAGSAVLDAIPTAQLENYDVMVDKVMPHFKHNPRDYLLGYFLSASLMNAGRADEAIAVSRRLYEERPDLQFGSDVAGHLLNNGRQAEVRDLSREWLRRSPGNEQALELQMGVESMTGEPEQVAQLANDLLLLHGSEQSRWLPIADAFIAVDLRREAHLWIDRVVSQDGLKRARGLYRQGVLAIYEGRFSAAEDALQSAQKEGSPFEAQFELFQTLEALRSVQLLNGNHEAALATTSRLLEVYRHFSFRGFAAVVEYELASQTPPCPSPERFLPATLGSPERVPARRDILRFASERGCAGCSEVLKAGRTPENSPRSLLAFGKCAISEGRLDLAEESLSDAAAHQNNSIGQWGRPSPVHSVLARYYLGQTFEKKAEPAKALVQYQRFLNSWGSVDSIVPEVAEARSAVERLKHRQ